MRPIGNRKQLEKRRQRAIAMLRKGMPFRIVAKELNASLSSVVRWFQDYRKKGRAGIRSQAKWGRPSHLDHQQIQQLKKTLLQGAVASGYNTELWTLKRIARLIRTHHGVQYSPVGVWKLLHYTLGWSCQKPEKRATQRKEKAIAHWKNTAWPLIKKNPRTWRPSGVS